MNWKRQCFIFIIAVAVVLNAVHAKLKLSSYPKNDDLVTIWRYGKSLMFCEVDSDQPFELKWFKDGEELDFKRKPPWPFPFSDGSGQTIVQWPYLKNRSRGTYECRATNGVDPPVSHKIKFTPLPKDQLPKGFPVITSPIHKTDHGSTQFYGTNFTLNCDAEGSGEMQILWTFHYVPLHKKFLWAKVKEEGFDYKLSNNNRTLHIYNLRKVYDAYVGCYAANDVGIIEVLRLHLDSYPVPIKKFPPVIISPPKNISVGGPEQWIEFYCNATGSPAPTYSWWHDDRWIEMESDSPKISLVAMRTGFLRCDAVNEVGKVSATAYITVKELPYRANEIKEVSKTSTSFTIKLTANYRESQWHSNIPITYAIIDHRPWHREIRFFEPFNQTTIQLDTSKPHGPWLYTWKDLAPWTWIDMRVRFGNKNGVGNVSDWKHDYSDWAAITEPVRNLQSEAHSNQSFTLKWENPIHTNGLVKRYELYWTRRPNDPLDKWIKNGIDPREQFFKLDWHGSAWILDVAPVLYWKVLIYGYVESTPPVSETKVFRVSPGAPGFVTNVSAFAVGATSIRVYWNATKQIGNGIIGHDVMYNRKDKPKLERDWEVIEINKPTKNMVTINGLQPNREYEFVVYPRSHAMIGVPSNHFVTKTFQAPPSSPPENVRGVAKSSETVQVSWDPPSEEHQNAPILSYDIYYTRKSGREPNKKVVDGATHQFLLQGLGKYTKYTVWIIARNIKGESPRSHSFEIITNEEVPKGAPRSVRAFAVNDTAIAITWLAPDQKINDGRIVGYKIFSREIYQTSEDQFEHEMKVLGAEVKDAIFTKWIAADRTFRFQVASFSNLGVGTRSNKVLVTTPKKLSPSPRVVLNLDLTTNYLTMKWWPRSQEIEQFQIVYGKSLRKFDMLTMRKIKLVAPQIRSSAFDDLAAGVYYCFKISAELKNDEGWTAEDIQWVKTTDGLPNGEPLYFEGSTESASTIRLKWEEPDPWKRNGDIKGYSISYKSNKDFNWLKKKYPLKAEEDAIIYILKDLHANTRYSVKVSAYTEVGSGPYTEEIQVRTSKEVLPVVEKLNVMDIKLDATTSLSSTAVHWNKPNNLNKFADIPMKYMLTYFSQKTYRDEYGRQQQLSVNKTIPVISEQYVIDDLQAGCAYTIWVVVDLDEVGLGEPIEIKISTPAQAPKEISPPRVNKTIEMTNYIPLKLTAASEEKGPVNHYLLFVIDLQKKSQLPPLLRSQDFSTAAAPKRRRKRALYGNNSVEAPDYNIAAFFQREEVPVLFKLGDGSKKDGYSNERLSAGNFYSTFLRAYVRQGDQYISTDSPFSSPVKYVPSQINVVSNGKVNDPRNAEEGGNGAVVMIAGAVAGVLVIIILIAIAIFIYKRRGGETSDKDRLLKSRSLRGKKSSDPAEVHRLNSNTPGMQRHPPIPTHSLAREVEQLKVNGGAKYLQEFESIDPGEKPPAEASNLIQNRTKNRYPNVVAYDDTRVKLDYNGTLCSDYINANYVDGYCQEKAYIATQGPLKSTIDDFWRLCWEQNVQTIVMMTKIEERGRSKCEEYWPSKGMEVYGNIRVTFKEERQLCNYCIRTFAVTSTVNGEERTVRHFQYLQWPDPGVPENPGPVLSFMRRVRAFQPPGSGPTLVHCSAGVGRSACFIAIDAMLERIKHDSMIDIYGYVTMMRTQRNFMVQTDEQYIFVYDVIVEAIECGDTEIVSTDFASEFKNLTELNANYSDTILERQFKSIALSHNYSIDPNLMSTAHSSTNEVKNRCRTIVPFDKNRVTLQPLRSHEGSDYINASYIDGYDKKNAFIATQGPLDSTVADFWRMVVEQDCSIVVMLTSLEEKGKSLCAQYWPSVKTMRHHYYIIEPVQENRFANFIVREFKITDARDDKTRHIRQYHYMNWPNGRVPENIEGITELIGHVRKAYEKGENDGPIIVHSSTGAGRTGVFIGLTIALDSLRKDGFIDFYQIVKGLRYERPFMVQSVEQYEYCYKVINDYLKSFDLVV